MNRVPLKVRAMEKASTKSKRVFSMRQVSSWLPKIKGEGPKESIGSSVMLKLPINIHCPSGSNALSWCHKKVRSLDDALGTYITAIEIRLFPISSCAHAVQPNSKVSKLLTAHDGLNSSVVPPYPRHVRKRLVGNQEE